MDNQKLVEFDKYCPKCKHYSKKESEDPCWDCLDNPVNTFSHKPTHFEEKDGLNNAKKQIKNS